MLVIQKLLCETYYLTLRMRKVLTVLFCYVVAYHCPASSAVENNFFYEHYYSDETLYYETLQEKKQC
jgi:hypothetical protein